MTQKPSGPATALETPLALSTPPETSPDRSDAPEGLQGMLRHLGGSRSDQWNLMLGLQVMATLRPQPSDEEMHSLQRDAVMAGTAGIGPRDELEGMMAAQLIAAHNAAMEGYRRAMIPGQTFEGRQEALNQANKLSRTWATLLDALNKHRGKGQQKVTVEHVHVHAGGQAVVGVVERSKGSGNSTSPASLGGGAPTEIEEQPHAKQLEHHRPAPEPALWGQDPERDPVPVAGGEGETPV